MGDRMEIIRQNVRAVVSDDNLADVFYWRALTSQATATPRTYGAWEYCEALMTGLHHEQAYDDKRQGYVVSERASWRLSDAWGPVAIGYQICKNPNDSDSPVWQILGVESGLPGSIRWQIGRDIPVIATADRGGGL